MEPGTAEPPNPPGTIAESPNPHDGNGERRLGAAELSPGTAGPQLGRPECCGALRAPRPVFESVRLLQSTGARRCARENFPGITARTSPSSLMYISVPTDSVLSQIKIKTLGKKKKNQQLPSAHRTCGKPPLFAFLNESSLKFKPTVPTFPKHAEPRLPLHGILCSPQRGVLQPDPSAPLSQNAEPGAPKCAFPVRI